MFVCSAALIMAKNTTNKIQKTYGKKKQFVIIQKINNQYRRTVYSPKKIYFFNNPTNTFYSNRTKSSH